MGMKDGKLEKLYERLCLTSVFIGVTEKPLYKAFSAYINAGDGYEKRKAYASFVARVYQNGGNAIRELGYRVESLARVASMSDDGNIEFC